MPGFTKHMLQVLTPADDLHHINKHNFKVPFVCGCRDLGEALRRVAEGAAMIRTKVSHQFYNMPWRLVIVCKLHLEPTLVLPAQESQSRFQCMLSHAHPARLEAKSLLHLVRKKRLNVTERDTGAGRGRHR